AAKSLEPWKCPFGHLQRRQPLIGAGDRQPTYLALDFPERHHGRHPQDKEPVRGCKPNDATPPHDISIVVSTKAASCAYATSASSASPREMRARDVSITSAYLTAFPQAGGRIGNLPFPALP